MKHVVKKLVLLVALTMMTMLTTYAKETSKVEVKVKQLTTKYDEVKLGEEKELADFDLVRCFVMPSDDKTISDFIIAVENKDSK